MARRSPSESDTNASPERRPASSEDTGADLARSIAGNVIERHSLAQREQEAASTSLQTATQRPSSDSPSPGAAEAATEQGAGSIGAIQQGAQMRDIGSQAALESDGPDMPPEQASIDNVRHQRIAIAAYYRAEHRGFEPGHEIEDWLEAEREVGEREGGGAVG